MQALRPTTSGQQPSFMKYFLEDPSLLQNINQKQKKKIILYDLPQIEPFRKLNKPVVSEQKKRIIKQKLDLEQQSMLQTKERERRNQYFLNYSDNPFIDLAPHMNPKRGSKKNQNDENKLNLQAKESNFIPKDLQQRSKIKQSEKGQYIYDIVTELNSMTQKKPQPQFIKLNDDFKKLMKDADLFSKKVIQISGNKQDFQFFRQKKSPTEEVIGCILDKGVNITNQKGRKSLEKEKVQPRNRSNTLSTQDGNKQPKKDPYGNPAIQKLPENTMSFEEIIDIKEDNFFMKPDPPQKPFNVLKISFNKNQKEIIGKQVLDKYNFNFTSMVEKITKIKIPIYRDISRMARRIALGISTGKQDRFDYIDSYELSFKTNNLNFSDLMSVASGRFTPEFIYKTTNFDVDQNNNKETSETTSQQEDEQIFYDDDTQNIAVRFHNRGEEQQQIINYLKLEYNSRELNYKAQCQQYKQSISSDLSMKEKLVSTTIQDKDLHGILNKSVKKQLKQFVNMDQKDIEIDRLIRMNKMNKNKNVAIKLGKVLEAFELKRNHNDVIERLGIVQDNKDFEEEEEEPQIKHVGEDNQIRLRPKIKSAIDPYSLHPNRHTKCAHQHLDHNDANKGQIYTSRTPQKRQEINNNKTPQKTTIDYRNTDKSPIKNTAKKTPAWRF